MISKLKILVVLFVSLCGLNFGQTLTGRVLDANTKQPLETVSVYFDNTTIGTTTDEDGNFSIEYTDAIQSMLVISYLGYERVFISDYRSLKATTVELKEATNELEEVVIDADDGLTRRQKLRLFRKEFLGSSDLGESCRILNEKDIRLRYNKQQRVLSASSKTPVIIVNKGLQYKISFDIIDFEINFRYADPVRDQFTTNSVTYSGTTFYKDLQLRQKRKIKKSRELAYKGSIQHFIRSLYKENLKDEDYWIFYDKFRVNEWSYFKVTSVENSSLKKVNLSSKVSIVYNKNVQSQLQFEVPEIYIDQYGNYSPILGVYFSGAMGKQRIGDLLPTDYELKSKPEIINDDFIEGVWKVVSVEESSKEKPFSLLTDSFKAARFTFNPDKTCKLMTSIDNQLFSLMTSIINQSNWEIMEQEKVPILGIINNGKTKLEIGITKKEKAIFFTLDKKGEPSYFVLKVEKV